jgi:uncharacterized protein (UPF0333 family)
MNNKGQAVLSEYVMIFFVVIAAGVAMTTYLQRGYEARIHDARNYLIDSLMNSGACDANCLAATGAAGNQIPYEYEPYYSIMLSNVQQDQNDISTSTNGSAQAIGAIYNKIYNEETGTNSTSYQLPPSNYTGV